MKLVPSLAALATLLCASSAAAQGGTAPAGLQLAWIAPAGCPQREAVLARVERFLGHALPHNHGDPLMVAASVGRGPPWHLQLAIASRSGDTTRRLEADSCDRLTDALALILALAVDPNAVQGAAPLPSTEPAASEGSGSSSAPGSRAPPAVDSVAPRASAPLVIFGAEPVTTPLPTAQPAARVAPLLDTEHPAAPRAPDPARPPMQRFILAGFGALSDVGILPDAGMGLEMRVGVVLGRSRLALRGDFWLSRSAMTVAGQLGFDLYTVGGQYCYLTAPGTFAMRVCGSLDAGHMRATGLSSSPNGTDGAFWAATFVELGASWSPVRNITLQLDAGPGLTLAGPRFIFFDGTIPFGTPATVAFQPSIVALRFGLTMDVLF